jgi:hypothetical protein
VLADHKLVRLKVLMERVALATSIELTRVEVKLRVFDLQSSALHFIITMAQLLVIRAAAVVMTAVTALLCPYH